MTFDDFQQETTRTWRFDLPDELTVIALGIAGEAGEVADYIKKVRAQGKEFRADELAAELGDVLYYLARAASTIGWTLEEVAEANYVKLRKRYPDGFTVAASAARVDLLPEVPYECGYDSPVRCIAPNLCQACEMRRHVEQTVIRR